jgi:hypothetical protein
MVLPFCKRPPSFWVLPMPDGTRLYVRPHHTCSRFRNTAVSSCYGRSWTCAVGREHYNQCSSKTRMTLISHRRGLPKSLIIFRPSLLNEYGLLMGHPLV